MKKRILLVLCAALVFGLAAVVFAYNQPVSDDKSAACCCKGDSCPMMKNKDSAAGDVKADGEKHNCCGDSCPMMKKHAAGHDSAQHSADHSKMAGMEHAKADAEAHSCCGDSCPMKKEHKEGEMADHSKMAGSMEHGKKDGESHICCACCKNDKSEKATA